jgi:carbohydrate-binding DOMON domain-containing protein
MVHPGKWRKFDVTGAEWVLGGTSSSSPLQIAFRPLVCVASLQIQSSVPCSVQSQHIPRKVNG